MNFDIIYEEQIFDKTIEIKNLSTSLQNSIEEFSNYVEQINEVIEALKVYMNTTGGIEKTEELKSILFNTNLLNNISTKSNNVSIEYKKEKVLIK